MIRKLKPKDVNEIMEIWLTENMKAHYFIPKKYWEDNFLMVKEIISQSEIYVYENEKDNKIYGFIGLNNNYIEGIFVSSISQSKGIGKQLMQYVKNIKNFLFLNVYEKNEKAINFYMSQNFKIENTTTDKNTNQKEYIMKWIKQ